LEELNLPLRALHASDVNHLEMLIPEEFSNSTAEEELGNKLKKLITSQ
jgi:hypothetical protein